MKKLFLALLTLPLFAAFTSCSDDDSKPQVYIDIDYGTSAVVDGSVYVVQPDTFKITSVRVSAVDENKQATNGPVSYFLNSVPLGTNPVEPFGIAIPTADLKPGAYAVQLVMPILEVGCELATAVTQVSVKVVADSTDIPTAAVPTSTQRLEYSYE